MSVSNVNTTRRAAPAAERPRGAIPAAEGQPVDTVRDGGPAPATPRDVSTIFDFPHPHFHYHFGYDRQRSTAFNTKVRKGRLRNSALIGRLSNAVYRCKATENPESHPRFPSDGCRKR